MANGCARCLEEWNVLPLETRREMTNAERRRYNSAAQTTVNGIPVCSRHVDAELQKTGKGMSATIELDATSDSLKLLADAVTRPLPRRRRRALRHVCRSCSRTFFRSRLSPHRCPHCHSDAIVQMIEEGRRT